MVERQLRARGIDDERVLAAMATVPRERFVPAGSARVAYRDRAVAIGEGQTVTQPWLVAAMAMLLELAGTERVLDVGAGSGYSAAILSCCCGEVIAVERHAVLADRARTLLVALGLDNIEVRHGDGTRGAPDAAPFGGISVAAAAEGSPPAALLDQLAPGAALVCPVRRGGDERLIRFRDGGEEEIAPVRFVPLVTDDGPAGAGR